MAKKNEPAVEEPAAEETLFEQLNVVAAEAPVTLTKYVRANDGTVASTPTVDVAETSWARNRKMWEAEGWRLAGNEPLHWVQVQPWQRNPGHDKVK